MSELQIPNCSNCGRAPNRVTVREGFHPICCDWCGTVLVRADMRVFPAPIAGTVVDAAGEPVVASAEEREYEIKIRKAEFDNDFRQLFVEFETDAPHMPWSKLTGPVVLGAYVAVRSHVDPSKLLGGGSSTSTALALGDGYAGGQPMGIAGREFARIPTMPTEDEIAAACRAALVKHLRDVEAETARVKVIENAATGLEGKSLKIKV